jgi:hypothetical protein
VKAASTASSIITTKNANNVLPAVQPIQDCNGAPITAKPSSVSLNTYILCTCHAVYSLYGSTCWHVHVALHYIHIVVSIIESKLYRYDGDCPCSHRICLILSVRTYVRLTCLQIPGYGKNALRKQLQYDSSYIDTMLEGREEKIDTEVCHINNQHMCSNICAI